MSAVCLRLTLFASLAAALTGCLNNPSRPLADDGGLDLDDGSANGDAPSTLGDARLDRAADSQAGDAVASETSPPPPDGGPIDAADAAPDSSGDGALEAAPCVSACTAGAKRCGTGGGLQICLVVGSCLDWGPETSCGPTATCAGTAPAAACTCKAAPAQCNGAGQFCADTNRLGSCVADAMGCLSVLPDLKTCPAGQGCGGAAPNAACGCSNTCNASQVGTYCAGAKMVATCTAASGCFNSSNAITCPGRQTCQGPAGTAACKCPAAGTTEGTGCATAGATACGGDTVLTCTADTTGSTCLTWVKTSDCATLAAGAFVCGTRGGPAACQCPDPSATQLFVDPVGGNDTATIVPNGASKPAACRFRTLTKALTAVTTTRKKLVALTTTPPASFSAETFPLMIPAGVTVTTGDTTPAPGNYTLVFNGASATAGVVLASGAVLEGFIVQAGSGNPAAAALSCSAGAVTVRASNIIGGAAAAVTKPATGIAVGGSCTAALQDLEVRTFRVGVSVASTATAASTISDSTLRDDGTTGAGAALLLAAGKLTATKLTINKSTAGSASWGVVLEGSSATSAPALTATDLTIAALPQPGLELRTGAAAPSATVTTGNIAAGLVAEVGVRTSAGTLALTGVTVHGAASDGLRVSGGVVSLGAGCHLDDNGRDGLRVESGTMVGTTFGASGNTGDGASISNGVVTLHRVTLADNDNRGLLVVGGTVVIDDGSIIRSNGAPGTIWSGIRVLGGDLTVGGTGGQLVDIADNSDSGVKITPAAAGTTVTIQRAKLHGSGKYGLEVDLAVAGSTVTVTDSDINANLDGVGVIRAPASAGQAVTLDGVRVFANGRNAMGGVGVSLRGDTGDVVATVKNSSVHDNRAEGLLVQQGATFTTTATIDGNDVFTNNTGAGRPVGGVLFATSSTLASFAGNKLHGNTGDELGFGAKPNGGDTWNLAGPLVCGAATNQIYCYGTGNLGLRILATAPVGTKVDAGSTAWNNALPTKGVDFEFDLSMTMDVIAAPACAASASACP
jgi:hypothetical protein